MSRVLLVEDDNALRRALSTSLHAWGYEALESEGGEQGLTRVANEQPDFVVLDLSLPGMDGIDALRHMRSFSSAPILVLTVRDGLRDRVTALESGADDFMTKPFEPDELLARIRAHLRRAESATPQPATVRSGALEIDLSRSLVKWKGAPIALTPTEFRLLEVLLANRGKLVTREQLLETVWGSRRLSDQGRLRVFVAHLRRKLHDDATKPRLIFTEPGLGYRWIAENEEPVDSGKR
jgi:two-component system, OmpR family, KDP operon response regulator KdpE